MSTDLGHRPPLVAGLRLVRLVGSGGEGEVWEARDTVGRRRALKLVRPNAVAADVEERVAHLVRIRHPALVRVHGGGRVADGPLAGWGWLDMDFVDGADLERAPADPEVLARLDPLAEALDLLHSGTWSRGVPLVHRDVKPANLIATDTGIVLVDPSTLRGADATELTRIGTPLYCAPEVVTGRVGPAADVYSFAATVVALSTGARGRDLAALLEQPDAVDLPPGVRLALSPSPGDRPASCRAVLTDAVTLVLPIPLPGEDDEGDVDAGGLDVEEADSARSWPWLAGLAVVALGPYLTLALEPAVPGAGLVAAAAVLHVLLCVAAGQPPLLAVAVPPLAWAFLLDDRLAGSGRRGYRLALVLGATTTLAAVLVLGVLPAPPLPRTAAASAVAAAWTLAAAAVAEVARGNALLRVLLLPVWLLGTALLVVGAVVVLPVAWPVGRARDVGRLLRDVLVGTADALGAR